VNLVNQSPRENDGCQPKVINSKTSDTASELRSSDFADPQRVNAIGNAYSASVADRFSPCKRPLASS